MDLFPYITSPINKITKTAFPSTFSKFEPAVIVDGITDWHAFDKWCPNYFLKLYPEKFTKLAIFSKKKHYRDPKIIENIALKNAINKITQNKNPNLKHYLLQQSIPCDYPELMLDINIPAWANITKKCLINLWFGENGNKTPLHFDLSHNLLAQLYGRKLIILFSPLQSESLYPTPFEMQKNFHLSQILNMETPDYKTFPAFKNAKGLSTILSPGEILFIPSGWWHYVVSLDVAISVNLFWQTTLEECSIPHVMRSMARFLYEKNQLTEIFKELDLSQFKNHLELAKYLVKKQCKWLAIFFLGTLMMDHIKAMCSQYAIKMESPQGLIDMFTLNTILSSIDSKIAFIPEKLTIILNLIEKAKQEQDHLLDSSEIEMFFSEVVRLMPSDPI